MSYRVEIEKGEDCDKLKIFTDNIPTAEYHSLYCVFSWIKRELEKAYQKGFEDGTHNEIIKRINR